MVEAYPLHWPDHYPRYQRFRGDSNFRTSFTKARDEMMREIALMGGKNTVLSSNLSLRRDGLPYANQSMCIDDPGVAVYFVYKDNQMCFACDRYRNIADNVQAIRKTIEAIRGIERWGASDMMERAFRGFVALTDGRDQPWHEVLGVSPDAHVTTIEQAYKRLRSDNHPDKGGNADQFNRIQKAYEQAKDHQPTS